MKQKWIAAAGALLLALCPLTGCGQQDNLNMTADEMPYGSTIIKKTDLSVPIQYDRRFLDDELVSTLASYYHALQEKDTAEFSALMFPLYHNYELETVYEGKYTDEDVVNNTHEAMASLHGGDFDFALIDVTDLITKQGTSENYDALYLMLDDLAEDAGEKPVTKDMQALYELTVDRYLCDKGQGIKGETDSLIEGERLFALKYENEWYLIYT